MRIIVFFIKFVQMELHTEDIVKNDGFSGKADRGFFRMNGKELVAFGKRNVL